MASDPTFTFEDLRTRALNKTILKGPYGRAWQGVMGRAWDEQIDRMYQARRARWPERCPLDGLFYIGVERGLERVFTFGTLAPEDEGSYRRRLREAWDVWKLKGTQVGHQESLRWCGLNNTSVHRRKEWSSMPEDGLPPYVRAFQRDVWAQFDVLVDTPPWRPLLWGSFNWGDPVTWGSTATPAEVALVKRLLTRFRSGHDTPMWVVINGTGGRVWGSWNWGDGSWTPGTGQPLRWLVGEPHWAQRGLA